jgi:hypothetical protein
MKKLILTFGLVVAAVLVSFAQVNETKATNEVVVTEQTADPVVIKFEEAPAEVQKAFNDSEYEKESIQVVHKIAEGNKNFYKVIVAVEGENWSLKYDAKGNLLETKEVA